MRAIFTGNLRFPDTIQVAEREWIVQKPFVVENLDNNKQLVQSLIPTGFRTDYGSIPQFLWGLLDPIGKDAAAFINHDFSYASEAFHRNICDWNLLCDLQEAGNCWLYRNTIYSHVRMYGGFVWDKHTIESITANQNLLNECRLLLSREDNPYDIKYNPSTGLYTKIGVDEK